jgi:predicted house-cleaning NTP pyrophosphatase (Maf/HAM1 superfamily)
MSFESSPYFEPLKQPGSPSSGELQIIETPEQAELALDAVFEDYFDPKQKIADFWHKRENWQPVPYRFTDPNNVMARQQYIEFADAIDQPSQLERWMLSRSILTLNRVAREDQQKWEAVRLPQLTTVRVGTQSWSKQVLIRPLIEAQGLVADFDSSQDYSDETEYQKLFRSLGATALGQAQALAHIKKSGDWTELRIGLDTTVVTETQLAHKPSSKDQARAALAFMSGRRVVVEDGIGVSLHTFKGERYNFTDSLAIEIALKSYNDQDIEHYLTVIGDRVLSIAGGIDYASAAGMELVSDEPVRVYMTGEQDITGRGLNPTNPRKTILLSKEAMPALRDYFIGVPKGPLERIIKGSKVIYSEL